MKKIILAIALVFIVSGALCAGTQTHNIVLISRVETIRPAFALADDSHIYGNEATVVSSSIQREDVSAKLSIIQLNDSNFRGNVRIRVDVSELASKSASTTGVRINGMQTSTYVSDLCYTAPKSAGTVGNLNIVWTHDPLLPEGEYEAVVRLQVIMD